MRENLIFSRLPVIIAIALSYSFPGTIFAADANRVDVKKIVADLKNPRGIAVRPDGAADAFEIFVAESGAGRIIKLSGNKLDARTDVVAGFAIASAANDDLNAPGVQSLQFLDHSRLVAIGGNDDGKPFARLYELPDADAPLSADQAKSEIEMATGDKDRPIDAPMFRSIARTQANNRVGDNLIIAASGGRQPRGLLYIPVRGGSLGEATPVHLKGADAEIEAGGIAVGPNGYAVVASNILQDSHGTSRLQFFHPVERRIAMQVSTRLQRIVALAYSPKSGNLYAANYPRSNESGGGIYRIDKSNNLGTTAVKAVAIAEVPRPTALVFAPDGTLYVASAGPAKDERSTAGALYKLTGDL